MPHSSGGGFHGGGFHGGGFHGGFHGGGFHSHGHGSYYRAHRISRFAFFGATRYVYYHHHRPHYIYSDNDPAEAEPKKAWTPVIILLIMLIIPVIVILVQGIHIPKKLSMNYDTTIVIDDAGDKLSDEEEARLKKTFISFQEKTGITPAFTSIDVWTSMFWMYGLEDYAYSDYVTKFKDEKHWLIVYQGGSNWAFEGMQGNDTDNILTGEVTKNFNSIVYNSLSSNVGVADSLIKGFDKISPTIMNNSFYLEEDLGAPIFFWIAITSVAFIFSIIRLVNTYHMQNAVKCPKETPLKHCPYCDSLYHPELTKRCPHCGAILKEEKPSSSEPKKEDDYSIDPDQYKIDSDQF